MDNDELLGSKLEARPDVGNMPMYSAIFALSHTIVGSGTLTMPYVFARCGYGLANVIAVVFVWLTTYSVHLLVVASDRVGGVGARSFESLGYRTCGTLGSIYAEITFIVGGIGTLTAYLIFIGKLTAQALGLEQTQAFVPIIACVVFVIMPMIWWRSLHSLRWVALIALVVVLFVVVIFVVFEANIGEYNLNLYPNEFQYESMRVAFWDGDSINSVNMLIGAFCLQNTCLPVYGELRERSPRKMAVAVLTSMAFSFAVYEAIGISGYRLIGGQVLGDSLLSFDQHFQAAYPWTVVPINLSKVLMSFMIALAVPFAIWPCRSAVCSVLSRAAVGCTGPARSSEEASDLMFRGVGGCIIAVVTVLAILTPSVTIPLGIVNSLAGGSMIFIMPGLFYLGSVDRTERFSLKHWTAHAYVVLGICFATISFSLEVRSIINKYG